MSCKNNGLLKAVACLAVLVTVIGAVIVVLPSAGAKDYDDAVLTDYLEYPKDKTLIANITASNQSKTTLAQRDVPVTKNVDPIELARYYGLGKSRIIKGKDDRKEVMNTKSKRYNSVVNIFSYPEENDWDVHRTKTCSGTVISSNTVLTAAHCVFNHEGSDDESPLESAKKDKLYAKFIIMPARNGESKISGVEGLSVKGDALPYGYYMSRKLIVARSYVDWGQSYYERDSYDWAVLKIDGTFDKKILPDRVASMTDKEFLDWKNELRISGYPANRGHCKNNDDIHRKEDCKTQWISGPDDNKDNGTMWTDVGFRRRTLGKDFLIDKKYAITTTDIDITGGNSGGGVVSSRGVVGITQSEWSYFDGVNIFVKITPNLKKVIVDYAKK